MGTMCKTERLGQAGNCVANLKEWKPSTIQKVTLRLLKFHLTEVYIIFDHFDVMFFVVPATPTVGKRDGYSVRANKWTVYSVSQYDCRN